MAWPLLRAGDIRSIADGTKLTEEQINQNDLVEVLPHVHALRLRRRPALHAGRPQRQDLDRRNRPLYTSMKEGNRRNPYNVPSVWKMMDMRSGWRRA